MTAATPCHRGVALINAVKQSDLGRTVTPSRPFQIHSFGKENSGAPVIGEVLPGQRDSFAQNNCTATDLPCHTAVATRDSGDSNQQKLSCGIPPMGDLLGATGGLKRDQTRQEHGIFNSRFNHNCNLILLQQ